ncbi:hypothetical protein [Bacillus sp. REN10]|uniref:hypothetical protein n=1 Tax=Bacillus sp. REN10 TaxID=2782541 RepID=UPI00193AFE70|nr:hypothetical protein [Bacillus sp. REN10]
MTGLVLVIPLLFILPAWLGVHGLWLVLPVAKVLTALMVFIMNRWRHPVPVEHVKTIA